MNIQAIYISTILALACVTFGLFFAGRFAPARGNGKRYLGKRKRALLRARGLVGEMRRCAHSPMPERWRQVDTLARLIVSSSERGGFPLYEAGTSLQEIQKLKLIVADKTKKRAETAPVAAEAETAAVVPVYEASIDLEAVPYDEELELDLAPNGAANEPRWRDQFAEIADTDSRPAPPPLVRFIDPTASISTSLRAAEALPHEWRESHEESLLASFDTMFDRSFKA